MLALDTGATLQSHAQHRPESSKHWLQHTINPGEDCLSNPLHPIKDASLDCHHVMFPPLIAMSRSTVTAMLAVRVDKPVAGAPNA